MPGRIFVTGGSGFVGSAIIEELLGRGYAVNALSRAHNSPSGDDRVRRIQGDLFDSQALMEGIRGCAAIVHLVGIIMEKPSKGATFQRIHIEGTRSVIEAARRAGVKRYIHMSALGSRPDAVSKYHQTKYKAEELARAGGLDWTIFRPSLIHGPRGEFMQMEARWARKQSPPWLFMPYFGAGLTRTGGAGRLQPVYVNDVARAFVDAIDNPKTIGEIYPLGGPNELTWKELHHASSQAIIGKKRWAAPLPAWYAKTLAATVPAFLLPFNRDQVIMSQENNTCDLTKFKDDFGWEPQPFAPTLQAYASQL